MMGTESDRQDTRKATVYDLQKILKRGGADKTYTVEEIIQIMDAYIDGTEQK